MFKPWYWYVQYRATGKIMSEVEEGPSAIPFAHETIEADHAGIIVRVGRYETFYMMTA